MKKALIVFAVVLLLVLNACGNEKPFLENTTCAQIMNAVTDVTGHPKADKIYLKSENNLDTYSLSLWADGLYQECDELDLISDYAIFVSAGTTTYEVAVLKTEDTDAVNSLKALIERRKETLSLGDKGMYDPEFEKRMSSSKILTVDNYVLFIVTDDNETALDAIEKLK